MQAVLASINIAPEIDADARYQDAAALAAGKGIVGDRNYRDGGAQAATQVTLIEREQITHVSTETGLSLTAADLRRNLETSGIRLNDLVGRRFRVGAVILEGIELCEPCAKLGQRLETDAHTPADIVRAFRRRGGLRARIVQGGTVRCGDAVVAD